MGNKFSLKILAISIVLVMVISCTTLSIAVDNPSIDNVFPSENITADNTPLNENVW